MPREALEVIAIDWIRNSNKGERCEPKEICWSEGVMNILKWFRHIERTDEALIKII